MPDRPAIECERAVTIGVRVVTEFKTNICSCIIHQTVICGELLTSQKILAVDNTCHAMSYDV